MELVEKKDAEHMMTYWRNWYADVDEKEMKKSDSKDKYVHAYCLRWTRVLKLDDNLSESSSESSSSFKSKCSNATSVDSDVSNQIVDLKRLVQLK